MTGPLDAALVAYIATAFTEVGIHVAVADRPSGNGIVGSMDAREPA